MKFLSLIVLASAASASYLDAVNARRSPSEGVEARQPHGPTPSNAPLVARHGPADDDHTKVVARKAHGPDPDDDHTGQKKGPSPRVRRQPPQKPKPTAPTKPKKNPTLRRERRDPPAPKPSMPPGMDMPGMDMGHGHSRRGRA